MEDATPFFPSWMRKVAFAGRRSKVYKTAQDVLKEEGVVVLNWNGSRKDVPDVLLMDKETARNPPKKVETVRIARKKIIDVNWVLRTLETGEPIDMAAYDLTNFCPDEDSDMSVDSASTESDTEMSFDSESDSDSSAQTPSPNPRSRKHRTAPVHDDDTDEEETMDDIPTLRQGASGTTLKPMDNFKVSDVPWWERNSTPAARPQWVGVGPVPGTNGVAPTTRTASRDKPWKPAQTKPSVRTRSMNKRADQSCNVSLSSSLKSNSSSTTSASHANRNRRHSPPKDMHARPAPPKRTVMVKKPELPSSKLLDKADAKKKSRTVYEKPWQAGSKKAKEEAREENIDHVMKALKEHEATRNIPNDILQGIRNEILDVSTLQERGITFDDVHGLEEAKKTLDRSVILPRKNPKLFQGLRKPAKGLLLFGPPGNGKTMLAKAVAAQCGLTFFNISASVLTSKMVGDGEKNVKALFACARALAPSFVFLDEIDSLLTTRGGGGNEHEASRRLKTEFLVQLDGAGASNNNVLVMAATNRPMDLDDAVLRRLEKRVYVPLPSQDTRLRYCHRVLEHDENLNIAFTPETWELLAQETQDYSFCDLANLCRELALAPLDDCNDLLLADVNDLRPINEGDVRKQLKKIRKSVSDVLLQQLIVWNEQFGAQAD
eukprot:TRINITY_DN37404_c0_g1_i1.p1 TRINITY_DN37404_c0_g1~~TRINITY_DN37404_c0_g1_i1.p1  ORF type:complete len:661 (+),score=168.36 TRINITY_DN37404_c0_g1_i1:61-2043(+)